MTEHLMARPRILAVDDEEGIRDVITHLFQIDGRYDLDVAIDGEDALRAIPNRSYNLVITDLQVPRMAGLALLHKIQDTHSELPSIVLTGYGKIEDAIQALRLGALNFLRKPFETNELMPAVERALEISRRRERTRTIHSYTVAMQFELSIPPRLVTHRSRYPTPRRSSRPDGTRLGNGNQEHLFSAR